MRRLLIKHDWSRRILLMALIAPFVFLWGEIFTRTLLPQNVDSKMNIFTSDPIVGFTYAPNASTFEKGREYNVLYQINSVGLRDKEYGEKNEGVFRVLLVGDSFSVSHGLSIEASLSKQMEKALNMTIGPKGEYKKIEVVNVAAGGYSPYNYWKAYRRWKNVFRPDAVLIGLSPDDFDCENENARYLIENGETFAVLKEGQLPARGKGTWVKKLRKLLSWNSEFYILMRNFFYYNDIVGRLTIWKSSETGENDGQLKFYMVSEQQSMVRAWSKAFSYIEKLKKETKADGIPLILIPIPLKMEIDPNQYKQTLISKGLNENNIDLDQQLREISAFCRKEGIHVLDPRPALRDHNTKVPCYFVYDGHWNAQGVNAAVRSLAMQWRDLRLPPWNY